MNEKSENCNSKEEHWLKTYWRPAMGWSYFVICLFDFLIAPIMNAVYFALFNITKFQQWEPLTLKGAGLYHIAMGAIIGVTAWSRGQEKITSSSSYSTPSGSFNSYSSPSSSGSSSYSPTTSGTASSYTPTSSSTSNNSANQQYPDDPVPRGGPFK